MWWSNLFVDMNKANFFNFSFLPKYATSFVRGLEYTLLLAVVSVLLAIIPALLLALMRLSKTASCGASPARTSPSSGRRRCSCSCRSSTSASSGPSPSPRVTILGFADISRFIPGVVALALNSSAYVAEIFRAGILAVDKGRPRRPARWASPAARRCASSCCRRRSKNVLPALANEIVTMVKESSICSMLGMEELMFGAKAVASATYVSLAPYTLAALIYFCINYPASKAIEAVERRMRRGDKQ